MPLYLGEPVSFGAAISSCLSQYAGFSGRARRSEYWFFFLFSFLAYLVAGALVVVPVSLGRVLALLICLGLILPAIAVTVRRLHDTGRSGAWILIGLIPFGGIVTLVFTCMDSEPYPNRYGPSPKPGVAGYGQHPFPAVGPGQQPYPAVGYGQPQYPAVGYGQPQYPANGYGQPTNPQQGNHPQSPQPPTAG